MSRSQRSKGAGGEREIAAVVRDLTGWDVRRRVRQHDGDTDLVGVPGWACEVKRHATAQRGDIRAWWNQAVDQAGRVSGAVPVLFFRRDRDEWRAVWPIAATLAIQHADMWTQYEYATEGSVQAWAAVARECLSTVIRGAE